MTVKTNNRFEKIRKGISGSIIYIIFILLIIFFWIVLGKTFVSYKNIMTILRQTAMISIMAIGMTFALSAGEIDLSVDSNIAFSAIIVALVLKGTNNIILAVIIGLCVGFFIGFFNGAIVAWLRVPSFLLTLASMGIIGGMSRWVTDNQSIAITQDRYNFIFGSGDIGPIPVLFIWTFFITLIGYLTLNVTAFGRRILASGGNEKAALYTGINTRMIKLKSLVISASSAALAGMLYAGRMHGARYTMGEGFVLSVIASTVIGGTGLFGGKGTVIGSLIGALVIGIINNGLILMGLNVAQQMVFKGIILIVAITINTQVEYRR
jgi:ribose transport system permease protein